MIARSSNDGLKHEAVHLIDRSLVTLITSESASVQSYILHPKTYMLTKTILYLKYVALTRRCQTFIPNELLSPLARVGIIQYAH